MAKKYVIANWKMHGNKQSITALINDIKHGFTANDCDVILLAPAIYLPLVAENIANSKLRLGAQNVYSQDSGAFTGEIAVPMLQDYGIDYALIGHSERRHVFHEDNELLAAKFHHVKASGLKPIFCVGETLQQRESGLTEEVIAEQLLAIKAKGDNQVFDNCIIAYEPVWAIGTGQTATPVQVQEVHAFIRNFVANSTTSILYGGSVNPENAAQLFATENVDGGLIGGASLNADKFLQIIAAVKT